MEENYKEFIAKIKYVVEYDTSKTRDDNALITEGKEVNENVPPRPPAPSATLKQGELPREDKRRKSITFINERLDHWVGEYLNEDNLGDDKTYKVPEKAKMQIENLLNEVGKLTALIQGR